MKLATCEENGESEVKNEGKTGSRRGENELRCLERLLSIVGGELSYSGLSFVPWVMTGLLGMEG